MANIGKEERTIEVLPIEEPAQAKEPAAEPTVQPAQAQEPVVEHTKVSQPA